MGLWRGNLRYTLIQNLKIDFHNLYSVGLSLHPKLFIKSLVNIQGHWGIENRLHWVRDVRFQEDFPPRRGGNAPVNWSILHNFFITIARKLSFRTIPQAQRALSNQLHKVFSFFG